MESFWQNYGIYFGLVLGSLILGSHFFHKKQMKKLRRSQLPIEANQQAYRTIFSPVHGKKRSLCNPSGSYGLLVDRISSAKIVPFIQLFFGGLLLLIGTTGLAADLGNMEKMISIGVIGAFILYVIYGLTHQVELYQYGFVVKNILGEDWFSYDEIHTINYTYENQTTRIRRSVWAGLLKVPKIVIYFNHGETVTLSNLVYSEVKSKIKNLETHLLPIEKNLKMGFKEEQSPF